MTLPRTGTILLAASLALAACNNPGRFGAGDGAGAGAGTGGITGPGVTSGALGDPSNPTSIAYFNQTVGDRVFFAVDQSTLSPEARATLTGQAQWLNANTQYGVILEGHADEQGTREYNLALGARRAAAAQDFLIAQGVSPSRIRTVSYGKERPVAVCSSEECWRQNRRAVTVLTLGAGS
jgi:peptidoglycan-associated lipoprotein